MVLLRDGSLSTASLKEKHFVDQGRLYGAIMNARTYQPVDGMVQVTVLSPSALDSDVMSNALFVLDAAGRRTLLQQRFDDAALVVYQMTLAFVTRRRDGRWRLSLLMKLYTASPWKPGSMT